jgi:hypothetical protein
MRRWLAILLTALALGASVYSAQAQTPGTGLDLRLSKINGFSMGGRIQGSFSLTGSGPPDMQHVIFRVDGVSIGDASAPPFRITFNTASFEVGRHELSAVGVTASGGSLQSNVLVVEFVSSDVARTSTLQIIIPVLAIVLVASVLAVIAPLLGGRGRGVQKIGEYGLAGGAVCGRCGLPFSRHFVTLRVFGQRLERCPHCGKWSFVGRASAEQLAQAEARLTAQDAASSAPPEDEDSLHRLIDDSRFED